MSREIDFVVNSVEDVPADSDRKARWTRIGVAFRNKDQSISVLCDAWPAGGHKMVLQVSKKDDQPEAS